MTAIEAGQVYCDPANEDHTLTVVEADLGTDGRPWGWWLVEHSYAATRVPNHFTDSHESYIKNFDLLEED